LDFGKKYSYFTIQIFLLVRPDTYLRDCPDEVAENDAEKNVKMEAGNIEKTVNGLCNFGGIFQLGQLSQVKILSLPVSLIINAYGHWLAIYIDEHSVEIMDSTGYLGTGGLHQTLRRFLSGHIYNKNFKITPRLQADDSNVCGLYAVSFLYYRTTTNQTLCEFCKLFTDDVNKNCKTIKKIYKIIQNIERK